ncbi:hypothetical protein BCR33DRAFT_838362 [Rhizoclosmatium globosum]|uniref:Uncharacterized protein n=1 Tax=Rhizoclosmatium globosum TaxID=329046 RepID=A0A1Y2BGB2_9FUNG|nr:hypothetical protein BCR33DRAFT_838362 [Rhizoclosmatium globosum]|eukprot:ORY33843.1 hypothetical protein BCR33DRAFT_838362 [Rhizoclosmatium globosum]
MQTNFLCKLWFPGPKAMQRAKSHWSHTAEFSTPCFKIVRLGVGGSGGIVGLVRQSWVGPKAMQRAKSHWSHTAKFSTPCFKIVRLGVGGSGGIDGLVRQCWVGPKAMQRAKSHWSHTAEFSTPCFKIVCLGVGGSGGIVGLVRQSWVGPKAMQRAKSHWSHTAEFSTPCFKIVRLGVGGSGGIDGLVRQCWVGPKAMQRAKSHWSHTAEFSTPCFKIVRLGVGGSGGIDGLVRQCWVGPKAMQRAKSHWSHTAEFSTPCFKIVRLGVGGSGGIDGLVRQCWVGPKAMQRAKSHWSHTAEFSTPCFKIVCLGVGGSGGIVGLVRQSWVGPKAMQRAKSHWSHTAEFSTPCFKIVRLGVGGSGGIDGLVRQCWVGPKAMQRAKSHWSHTAEFSTPCFKIVCLGVGGSGGIVGLVRQSWVGPKAMQRAKSHWSHTAKFSTPCFKIVRLGVGGSGGIDGLVRQRQRRLGGLDGFLCKLWFPGPKAMQRAKSHWSHTAEFSTPCFKIVRLGVGGSGIDGLVRQCWVGPKAMQRAKSHWSHTAEFSTPCFKIVRLGVGGSGGIDGLVRQCWVGPKAMQRAKSHWSHTAEFSTPCFKIVCLGVGGSGGIVGLVRQSWVGPKAMQRAKSHWSHTAEFSTPCFKIVRLGVGGSGGIDGLVRQCWVGPKAMQRAKSHWSHTAEFSTPCFKIVRLGVGGSGGIVGLVRQSWVGPKAMQRAKSHWSHTAEFSTPCFKIVRLGVGGSGGIDGLRQRRLGGLDGFLCKLWFPGPKAMQRAKSHWSHTAEFSTPCFKIVCLGVGGSGGIVGLVRQSWVGASVLGWCVSVRDILVGWMGSSASYGFQGLRQCNEQSRIGPIQPSFQLLASRLCVWVLVVLVVLMGWCVSVGLVRQRQRRLGGLDGFLCKLWFPGPKAMQRAKSHWSHTAEFSTPCFKIVRLGVGGSGGIVGLVRQSWVSASVLGWCVSVRDILVGWMGSSASYGFQGLRQCNEQSRIGPIQPSFQLLASRLCVWVLVVLVVLMGWCVSVGLVRQRQRRLGGLDGFLCKLWFPGPKAMQRAKSHWSHTAEFSTPCFKIVRLGVGGSGGIDGLVRQCWVGPKAMQRAKSHWSHTAEFSTPCFKIVRLGVGGSGGIVGLVRQSWVGPKAMQRAKSHWSHTAEFSTPCFKIVRLGVGGSGGIDGLVRQCWVGPKAMQRAKSHWSHTAEFSTPCFKIVRLGVGGSGGIDGLVRQCWVGPKAMQRAKSHWSHTAEFSTPCFKIVRLGVGGSGGIDGLVRQCWVGPKAIQRAKSHWSHTAEFSTPCFKIVRLGVGGSGGIVGLVRQSWVGPKAMQRAKSHWSHTAEFSTPCFKIVRLGVGGSGGIDGLVRQCWVGPKAMQRAKSHWSHTAEFSTPCFKIVRLGVGGSGGIDGLVRQCWVGPKAMQRAKSHWSHTAEFSTPCFKIVRLGVGGSGGIDGLRQRRLGGLDGFLCKLWFPGPKAMQRAKSHWSHTAEFSTPCFKIVRLGVGGSGGIVGLVRQSWVGASELGWCVSVGLVRQRQRRLGGLDGFLCKLWFPGPKAMQRAKSHWSHTAEFSTPCFKIVRLGVGGSGGIDGLVRQCWVGPKAMQRAKSHWSHTAEFSTPCFKIVRLGVGGSGGIDGLVRQCWVGPKAMQRAKSHWSHTAEFSTPCFKIVRLGVGGSGGIDGLRQRRLGGLDGFLCKLWFPGPKAMQRAKSHWSHTAEFSTPCFKIVRLGVGGSGGIVGLVRQSWVGASELGWCVSVGLVRQRQRRLGGLDGFLCKLWFPGPKAMQRAKSHWSHTAEFSTPCFKIVRLGVGGSGGIVGLVRQSWVGASVLGWCVSVGLVRQRQRHLGGLDGFLCKLWFPGPKAMQRAKSHWSHTAEFSTPCFKIVRLGVGGSGGIDGLVRQRQRRLGGLDGFLCKLWFPGPKAMQRAKSHWSHTAEFSTPCFKIVRLGVGGSGGIDGLRQRRLGGLDGFLCKLWFPGPKAMQRAKSHWSHTAEFSTPCFKIVRLGVGGSGGIVGLVRQSWVGASELGWCVSVGLVRQRQRRLGGLDGFLCKLWFPGPKAMQRAKSHWSHTAEFSTPCFKIVRLGVGGSGGIVGLVRQSWVGASVLGWCVSVGLVRQRQRHLGGLDGFLCKLWFLGPKAMQRAKSHWSHTAEFSTPCFKIVCLGVGGSGGIDGLVRQRQRRLGGLDGFLCKLWFPGPKAMQRAKSHWSHTAEFSTPCFKIVCLGVGGSGGIDGLVRQRQRRLGGLDGFLCKLWFPGPKAMQRAKSHWSHTAEFSTPCFKIVCLGVGGSGGIDGLRQRRLGGLDGFLCKLWFPAPKAMQRAKSHWSHTAEFSTPCFKIVRLGVGGSGSIVGLVRQSWVGVSVLGWCVSVRDVLVGWMGSSASYGFQGLRQCNKWWFW